jgi:hypothetical protein
MEALEFIRAGLTVDLLVAETVEQVLPKLRGALSPIAEPEKKMKSVEAERM